MKRMLLRATIIGAVTLALLAMIETGLAMAGVRGLVADHDPFRGFSRRIRVFATDRDRGVYVTPPASVARSFNHQEFRLDKPPNGFRIFTLGGSSAYGFPWGADIAFTKVLGDALRASRPERTIDAVNASGMSYGSNRLRVLTHEILEYDPDVVVFYEGHNEFVEARFYRELVDRDERLDAARSWLHRWRLFTIATHVSERINAADRQQPPSAAALVGIDVDRDEPTGVDAEEKERVRARFEENLRDIVARVHAAGKTMVLCTVAANLRDWRPYQSEDAAKQFALARSYEAVAQWDAARQAYSLARDTDTLPARVLSSINATTRRVAAETGALLVDIERIFEEASPNGLVGFNLIEDYVHPTPHGHRLIALALWRAFESAGLAGPSRTATADEFWRAVGDAPTDPLKVGSGSVPPWRAAALLYNTGVILEHQGQHDRAIEKYREALAIYAGNFGAAVNLARLLEMRKELNGAESAYRRAVELQPQSARALGGLGRTLVQLGRAADAERILARAVAIEPRSVGSLSFLGHARRMQGNLTGAEEAYRAALALDPNDQFVIANLNSLGVK